MPEKILTPVSIGATAYNGRVQVLFFGTHRDEDFAIELTSAKALYLITDIAKAIRENQK